MLLNKICQFQNSSFKIKGMQYSQTLEYGSVNDKSQPKSLERLQS